MKNLLGAIPLGSKSAAQEVVVVVLIVVVVVVHWDCTSSQSRCASPSVWVLRILGKCQKNQHLAVSSLRTVVYSPRVCCSSAGTTRMAAPGHRDQASHEGSAADAAAAPKNSGNPKKSVHVIIKGIVQGVFYRKWTIETAKKQGLDGWVRNCQDGSVEAVFSGSSNIVDNMIEKCRVGPSLAQVTGLTVSSWDTPVPKGFEQKSTTW